MKVYIFSIFGELDESGDGFSVTQVLWRVEKSDVSPSGFFAMLALLP